MTFDPWNDAFEHRGIRDDLSYAARELVLAVVAQDQFAWNTMQAGDLNRCVIDRLVVELGLVGRPRLGPARPRLHVEALKVVRGKLGPYEVRVRGTRLLTLVVLAALAEPDGPHASAVLGLAATAHALGRAEVLR